MGNRIRQALACLAAGALIVAVTASQAAYAQVSTNQPTTGAASTGVSGAPSAAPAAGSSSSRPTLQEVVITAERRAQNILLTPISIQATSGNQLQALHVTNIQKLTNITPSFQAQTSGLFTSTNVRGIGNDSFGPAITSGVPMLRDGLVLEEEHELSDPFFDIRDVEVLRGPQGTIVGYSSLGGAVYVNSNDPNLAAFGGFIDGQLGTYSDKKIDGAVNLPVTRTFAMRLAFNDESRGSFYRDIGSLIIPGPAKPILDPGAVENKDARIGLLWKPTSNFQALLKAEWNRQENPGGVAAVPIQAAFTLPQGAPNICPSGSPGPVCHSPYYAYSTHIPFVLNYNSLSQFNPYQDYRYSLDLRYTLPDGTVLRALSGLQQSGWKSGNDGDASAANASETYQYIPKDDYYSEEFNIISPTTGPFFSVFNYLAGATFYYRNTGVTVFSYNYFPPNTPATPQIVALNEDNINRMDGVWGRVSWQFAPTLQLQVGARENWDNNYSRGPIGQVEIYNFPLPCTEAPVPAGYGCIDLPFTGSQKDSVPTGKVTLNWTPRPGQFFYVFYARGYKEGGFQAGALQPFRPEHVNDYEIGWKATSLGGRLQTTIDGYWSIYQGMQFGIYEPQTGTSGIDVNLPSAANLRGIEASVRGRFGGLGIDFSGAYEKSSLGSLTTVASYALPPSASRKPQCAPGQTVGCFDYRPYEVNLTGEVMPFAPELETNLAVDYAITVGRGSLDPRIDYAYTGKQYTTLFQIPFYRVGARSIWNASLTYDVGKWETQAYITNFTNEVYLEGQMGNNQYYGPPRQFGIRLRKDF